IVHERLRRPVRRDRRIDDPWRERGESGVHLRRSEPRLWPSRDLERPHGSIVQLTAGTEEDLVGAEGDEELRPVADAQAEEAAVGDADDLEGMALERERLPHGARIAGITAVPESFAQHDGPGTAAIIVAGLEQPSGDGTDAQGPE